MTDGEHPELRPNNLASSIDKVVAIRIRECRVTRGLTQKQVANMIGVAYQQVQNYECGIHSTLEPTCGPLACAAR
jgi:transcriptional regulator with XRE-family HTH domain